MKVERCSLLVARDPGHETGSQHRTTSNAEFSVEVSQ